MIEIQFAVIVLLIVMTLVLCKYYNTRFRALEDKMKDVADFQQSVKELAEVVQDLKEAVQSEKQVQPVPEKQELAHPVVPVGQRQPAVVAARPMAVVQETASEAAQDGVEDEVVAVIMAAVAAYGYPPSAIRSIRPQKRGYKRHRENWAMAARLGGMNR